MARPFRFGVVFTQGTDAHAWSEFARRVEGEGFSSLLVADHYGNPMSCGPLVTAAACATTTLRVGSFVYNNDFRHPVLLAKEAATIDVLSRGRMELGIGAGYAKEEYDAAGLPFDPPGVRMSRFEESVEIVRRLFRGGQVSFDGANYQLNGQEGLPVPVQQPIPLMIGGGGPRMTRFAARVANIVAFVPPARKEGGLDETQFAAEALDQKITLLDRAIGDAGRIDGGPERNLLIFGIYPSLAAVPADNWIPPTLVPTSPYALVGDVEAMVDALHARRERWGLSYFVCFEYQFEAMLPLVRRLSA